MNLREMEVFRAVMLAGTVKGAGALLNVSQPAASKMLALAERRSGLRLFERVKGRLVPTPEAHQLYPEIEAVWKTVAKARDVSRELANPRGGSLRVAAGARFCTYLLPSTVKQLFEGRPSLQVRVDMMMPHLVTDALMNGTADVAVVMGPIDQPGIETVWRQVCGLVCVMPESHRLAHRKIVRRSDLAGERLISISDAMSSGHAGEGIYGDLFKGLPVALEVSSAPSACWFAQAGAGIAVVDAATVAGQTFAGLVARPIGPSQALDVRILRNVYRPLSQASAAFCATFDALWRRDMPAVRRPRSV